MTTWRLLPRDEWPERLAGTELETIWPVLPDGAHIVVVESDGRLAASWAVYPQWHVEGINVAPEFQKNPAVGRKLLHGMLNTALAVGAATVQTAALSDEIAGMLAKIGAVELPGRHFAMRIKATGRM